MFDVEIRVSVRLYNRLQRLLPPEAQGKTELTLAEGSSLKDVCEILKIERSYPIAVNGVLERDLDRILEQGDLVSAFAPIGGG